jgi:hypothetical protein
MQAEPQREINEVVDEKTTDISHGYQNSPFPDESPLTGYSANDADSRSDGALGRHP